MLGLFRFDPYDVFTGKAPIRVAMAYLNRLPHEVNSVWRANQLGGLEHFGWDITAYRLADLIDAVQLNTVVSGNVGSTKAPESPEPFYRPGIEAKERREPATPAAPTLAEFPWEQLARQTGGELDGSY